jgi:uncharacterized protein YndB with AHSA1/START domain
MTKTTYVYVTYIRTTPEKLWAALTNAEFIQQYWFGCRCESDWKVGSPWKLISPDGVTMDSGEILEADFPRLLVIRWHHQHKPDLHAEGPSTCIMELEPSAGAVKFSVTHTIGQDPSKFIEAVSGGWPKVISNLKSLLETGSVAMDEPYPAQRAAS